MSHFFPAFLASFLLLQIFVVQSVRDSVDLRLGFSSVTLRFNSDNLLCVLCTKISFIFLKTSFTISNHYMHSFKNTQCLKIIIIIQLEFSCQKWFNLHFRIFSITIRIEKYYTLSNTSRILKMRLFKRFLNIVYVALQNTVVIQFVSIWGFAPRVGLIVYHNVAGKFATLITI